MQNQPRIPILARAARVNARAIAGLDGAALSDECDAGRAGNLRRAQLAAMVLEI